MQLRFANLRGLDESMETSYKAFEEVPLVPSVASSETTVLLRQRLWTCSETSVALLCAILLCFFGFVRILDGSQSFVQTGVASRMNMAAPFVYGTAFLISGLHYAFLSLPRTSASLKYIDASSMAVALAWMTTLLVFNAATQPTLDRALLPGFRYTAYIDAPVSAGVFIIILFLSRSFTPSSLTSTYDQREPLLIEEGQHNSKMSLLEWHASLDSSVVTTRPLPQTSNELRFQTKQLLGLERASGLVPNQLGLSTSLSRPSTLSQPLLSKELPSKQPERATRLVLEGVEGVDVRSSHAHFDPAWDWVRQCLLGVLIVSWINQLALLTEGLRVRASNTAPEVALTQSISSIALLFSAYFQFVNCPEKVYLVGPVLWRLMAFLGVALTIVASDVMLLSWQATL